MSSAMEFASPKAEMDVKETTEKFGAGEIGVVPLPAALAQEDPVEEPFVLPQAFVPRLVCPPFRDVGGGLGWLRPGARLSTLAECATLPAPLYLQPCCLCMGVHWSRRRSRGRRGCCRLTSLWPGLSVPACVVCVEEPFTAPFELPCPLAPLPHRPWRLLPPPLCSLFSFLYSYG
jgi:hypothetical protein